MRYEKLIFAAILVLVPAVLLGLGDPSPAPFAGPMISVPAVINDVHDGDTLTVSVDFSMNVRLLDCWAPELKTGEPGRASKANLIRLTSKNQRCMVHIPLHDNLGKSTSLGRILGYVKVNGQDKDLSSQQVEGGFATKDRD